MTLNRMVCTEGTSLYIVVDCCYSLHKRIMKLKVKKRKESLNTRKRTQELPTHSILVYTQHHTKHLLRTWLLLQPPHSDLLKSSHTERSLWVSRLHHFFVQVINITFEVQVNGDRLRVRLGFFRFGWFIFGPTLSLLLRGRGQKLLGFFFQTLWPKRKRKLTLARQLFLY